MGSREVKYVWNSRPEPSGKKTYWKNFRKYLNTNFTKTGFPHDTLFFEAVAIWEKALVGCFLFLTLFFKFQLCSRSHQSREVLAESNNAFSIIA